jgi:hypothetical protein
VAKIILKCPYLKPDAGKRAGGYLRYIATRAGVRMPDDSKQLLPVTQVQKKTIAQLLSAHPDLAELYEYTDYLKEPTRENATEFVARSAETCPELLSRARSGYLAYIATRPGAVKLQQHGLFSDAGEPVILERAAREAVAHTGNIWCHIVSLRREDAARLGYDDVKAWQNLLRSQRNVIAEAMKIRPEHFRWYAAFHDEGHHPHIHMVAYSVDPAEPWLSEEGILKMKAALAKQIFRQDNLCIYEKQTEYRNALRNEGAKVAAEIVHDLQSGVYDNPVTADLLLRLAEKLKTASGKKIYGYLKADTKALVDLIACELAKDERIAKLYDLWYEQREEVIRTYTSKLPERVPLPENKEFKSIKNAVIREAMRLSEDYPFLENDDAGFDSDMQDDLRGRERLPGDVDSPRVWPFAFDLGDDDSISASGIPHTDIFSHDADEENRSMHMMNAMAGSMRLIGQLSRIIERGIADGRKHDGLGIIDHKERRQIDEKRQAHGLRYG